jgi:L-asparagine oxygenase
VGEQLVNLATQLLEKGYAQIRANNIEESTFGLATRIGSVSSIPGISTVQLLSPYTQACAPLNSYGSIYGLGHFPLHTDMAHWYAPPRYLLLRCIRPAPEVKTLILHSDRIFADEDEVTLRRALFRPRRPLDSRLTALRVFESGRCRWDSVFIIPMTLTAMELRERILERIDTAAIEEVSLLDSSDAVIIDNWRVLHGRRDVSLTSVHRKIERIYLDSVYL